MTYDQPAPADGAGRNIGACREEQGEFGVAAGSRVPRLCWAISFRDNRERSLRRGRDGTALSITPLGKLARRVPRSPPRRALLEELSTARVTSADEGIT